jgi:hypothetical protein
VTSALSMRAEKALPTEADVVLPKRADVGWGLAKRPDRLRKKTSNRPISVLSDLDRLSKTRRAYANNEQQWYDFSHRGLSLLIQQASIGEGPYKNQVASTGDLFIEARKSRPA